MRASTWDQEWVYGLYESAQAAEALVRDAEATGITKRDLVVLTPDALQKRRFADIMPEEHHPEWKWAVTGGVIGFVVGNIVGHVLMHAVASGFNWIATMLIALIPGFGGAIAGTFLGLQSAGVDASLNALYEDSGAEGKIMVAIKCDPKHPEITDKLEQLFLKSGVKPIEFPHTHLH